MVKELNNVAVNYPDLVDKMEILLTAKMSRILFVFRYLSFFVRKVYEFFIPFQKPINFTDSVRLISNKIQRL